MLKKLLILVSFVLFTYSFFAFVSGVAPSSCGFCVDTSLQCLLSLGWNMGVAQSDEEWYGFNCGRDSYNQLKIRTTAGGDYSLCKIKYQEPMECPTSTDICVADGEVLGFYQSSDDTYWVLARRISGDPGFEIYLYCLTGPFPDPTTTEPSGGTGDGGIQTTTTIASPVTTVSVTDITTTILITTTTPITSTHPSSYYEKYSSVFWIIFLVIIIVVAVISYRFMIGKKQQLEADFQIETS